MYSKLENKKEEGKKMRIEGGYNFYARDFVKHFTLIISLNIFNIIIQFSRCENCSLESFVYFPIITLTT